jgi:hypothetical protein
LTVIVWANDNPSFSPNLRQLCTPAMSASQDLDIANTDLYLGWDEAEFVSGACLEVDRARSV